MKRILKYILPVVAIVGACSSPQREAVNAAMELYEQYCNHSDELTVAFIGDFEAGGMTYNTVMFHTDDSAEWEWVKKEFGMAKIDPQHLGISDAPIKSDVMALPMTIDVELDAMTEEEQERYMDSLIRNMLAQMLGLDADDDSLMANVIVMNINDSEIDDPTQFAQSVLDEKILKPAQEQGDKGYLVSVDQEEQNLWIFFYSTDEEQQVLMEHIFKEKKNKAMELDQKAK